MVTLKTQILDLGTLKFRGLYVNTALYLHPIHFQRNILFQDFTLDFYMRQTWQDPRLAFGTLDLGMAKHITSLTVSLTRQYIEQRN